MVRADRHRDATAPPPSWKPGGAARAPPPLPAPPRSPRGPPPPAGATRAVWSPTHSLASSSISIFFWHPVTGKAMLSCAGREEEALVGGASRRRGRLHGPSGAGRRWRRPVGGCGGSVACSTHLHGAPITALHCRQGGGLEEGAAGSRPRYGPGCRRPVPGAAALRIRQGSRGGKRTARAGGGALRGAGDGGEGWGRWFRGKKKAGPDVAVERPRGLCARSRSIGSASDARTGL